MTGPSISSHVNNYLLQVCGGKSTDEGATIRLYGNDASTEAGNFYIYTNNGNSSCILTGRPTGGLYWGGKSIDVIEEQGDGYIRYTNGIQICWGKDLYHSGQVVSYAKAFSENPSVVVSGWIVAAFWYTSYFTMIMGDGSDAYASYQAIGRWK